MIPESRISRSWRAWKAQKEEWAGLRDLRHRQDEALNSALGLGLLDAFTIGAESISEQEDLIRRIAAA